MAYILVAATFNYEHFFNEQLERKKQDNSYRVFKKVARKGASFPMALEGSGKSDDARDVTVWCSNDYLGMSWHPSVQAAVRCMSTFYSYVAMTLCKCCNMYA